MADMAPELRIVEYQNEWIVGGRYPFVHEPWATPQLAELRDRYHLDTVVAAGRTEWEQLLLLREWVHGRWDHGWSTARSTDALDILAKAEQGHDFSCGYYSTTLAQCALALGFQARRLGIGKTETAWMGAGEGNIGHSVPEVWAQDWHKWVVLDPDMNIHYEHQGTPLSALEVHRLWKAGRWREIAVARGEVPFRTTSKPQSAWTWSAETVRDIFADFARHQATDYYSLLRWEMRNDLFSSPEATPGLRWFDHTESPQLVHANQPILTDHWTSDERDAYWSLNQAQIGLRLTSNDLARPVVRVEIEHSMPNLDRLLFKLCEEGPWQRYREPFHWPMRPGKNIIAARPLNAHGREGYTSRIVLRFLGADA